MDLLYDIRILAADYFVVTMHAFDRRTDSQTDRCRQEDRAYAFVIAQ